MRRATKTLPSPQNPLRGGEEDTGRGCLGNQDGRPYALAAGEGKLRHHKEHRSKDLCGAQAFKPVFRDDP